MGILDRFKKLLKTTDDVKEVRDRIRMSPAEPSLHQRLAERLAKRGEYSDAISEYYTASSLFEKGGFGARATAVLKQCLKLDPTNLETVKKLMDSLVANGLSGDAVFEFQKVLGGKDVFISTQQREEFIDFSLRILGDIPEIHIFIIKDCMKNRNIMGVASSVEKAIPNVKSPRQLDNFLSVIEEITKKKDNPLYIWEVCGLSLLSYGHREKGFQMIQKIEEAGPGKETSGIVSKVKDYFGTVEEEHTFPKNFSSVEKYLSEKVVSEETERIEKEEEEADQGKVERAEDIEAVLDQLREKVEDEIGEEDLNARYNLGIAFKEMGLFEDAIREFTLSKEEESLYLSSLLMLKDCYEKMERFDEGLTLIDELLSDEGLEERARIDILYQKGVLLEKMGDEDGSIGVYRQVYEIDEGYKNVSEKIKDH